MCVCARVSGFLCVCVCCWLCCFFVATGGGVARVFLCLLLRRGVFCIFAVAAEGVLFAVAVVRGGGVFVFSLLLR